MISLQTALIRLGLALVLGALVGLERERGERAAGLRTHTLVALGSCLTMLVSAFGFADILGTRAVELDPSRIAAQVVSGIGFLGAGTILLHKEVVKGLTTAAAVWVVAAIGLACGAGLLLEAIATTFLTIIVLTLLQPLRQHLLRNPGAVHTLRVKVSATEGTPLERIYDTCIRAGAKVENFEVQLIDDKQTLNIECATKGAFQLAQELITLRKDPAVESLSINLYSPKSANAPFPLFPESSNGEAQEGQ
ncbi:MgtC/SapB family protein [Ktedonosporobacter rubrisoli]|uniref:MgtC/SapB family protein n=1 Tax=Ktedonosporobacter rubrisoli TaxID=2509675 RepID=A0A4P6K3L5_KTERU|nr:MgtC/SapB family protein [Ktedonosporobacter rubrisoli]QBD82503.1 MgtC/SapB family protein [Ktedonosporobacter rubrisoli]